MKLNNFFAGILAAGIVFVGGSEISYIIFSPDKLEKQAYEIDVAAASQGGASDAPKGPAYLTGDEFAALVAAGDIAKGERVVKKCTACHSFNKGGANKVGPALWGIVDADIAAVAGYNYSAVLQGLEGNWTVENLNGWLYKPKAFAKGNKMSFAGIKNDQQRADLIAYMKTLK
ncbi:MAG: cytochrome c family protein [Pseudomonadota bacterium]